MQNWEEKCYLFDYLTVAVLQHWALQQVQRYNGLIHSFYSARLHTVLGFNALNIHHTSGQQQTLRHFIFQCIFKN